MRLGQGLGFVAKKKKQKKKQKEKKGRSVR
jgi:hypothetical protein